MNDTAKYTILFVDDEPWLSQPLRLALEGRGCECITSNDASNAWEILDRKYIDVVVTDIMMPGGDIFSGVDAQEMGFEFVRRILDRWPDQPIICLSVIGDVNRISELKSQNVLYLRKGETPLKTAVKLIISKASGITTFE